MKLNLIGYVFEKFVFNRFCVLLILSFQFLTFSCKTVAKKELVASKQYYDFSISEKDITLLTEECVKKKAANCLEKISIFSSLETVSECNENRYPIAIDPSNVVNSDISPINISTSPSSLKGDFVISTQSISMSDIFDKLINDPNNSKLGKYDHLQFTAMSSKGKGTDPVTVNKKYFLTYQVQVWYKSGVGQGAPIFTNPSPPWFTSPRN